ncbi:MAG: hypothetical protein EOO11_22610, partial [Chitinophagaceae bacterium]
MKTTIRYHTEYLYEEPVSFSPHIFRLFPKADTHISVERLVFETNEGAQVQHRRDLFDNMTASCFYPGLHPAMWARLEIDLNIQERNAFHFLLASHALELPFQYEPRERLTLEPFLHPLNPKVELPFWKFEPKPTVSALIDLNTALFENLKYERREEGARRRLLQLRHVALPRGAHPGDDAVHRQQHAAPHDEQRDHRDEQGLDEPAREVAHPDGVDDVVDIGGVGVVGDGDGRQRVAPHHLDVFEKGAPAGGGEARERGVGG